MLAVCAMSYLIAFPVYSMMQWHGQSQRKYQGQSQRQGQGQLTSNFGFTPTSIRVFPKMLLANLEQTSMKYEKVMHADIHTFWQAVGRHAVDR